MQVPLAGGEGRAVRDTQSRYSMLLLLLTVSQVCAEAYGAKKNL